MEAQYRTEINTLFCVYLQIIYVPVSLMKLQLRVRQTDHLYSCALSFISISIAEQQQRNVTLNKAKDKLYRL